MTTLISADLTDSIGEEQCVCKCRGTELLFSRELAHAPFLEVFSPKPIWQKVISNQLTVNLSHLNSREVHVTLTLPPKGSYRPREVILP